MIVRWFLNDFWWVWRIFVFFWFLKCLVICGWVQLFPDSFLGKSSPTRIRHGSDKDPRRIRQGSDKDPQNPDKDPSGHRSDQTGQPETRQGVAGICGFFVKFAEHLPNICRNFAEMLGPQKELGEAKQSQKLRFYSKHYAMSGVFSSLSWFFPRKCWTEKVRQGSDKRSDNDRQWSDKDPTRI